MAIVDLANAQLQQAGAGAAAATMRDDDDGHDHEQESSYDYGACLMKGVRHLSDSGITRLPDRYVLPASDRPGAATVLISPSSTTPSAGVAVGRVKLPVVDLAGLRDPSQRSAVLATLDAACRDYGFFQVRRTYTYIPGSCMRVRVTSACSLELIRQIRQTFNNVFRSQQMSKQTILLTAHQQQQQSRQLIVSSSCWCSLCRW